MAERLGIVLMHGLRQLRGISLWAAGFLAAHCAAFLPTGVASAQGNKWNAHFVSWTAFASTGELWPLAATWPGMPPPLTPAMLQKFSALLATFQALGEDSSITFPQWILMNGVVDPREQICLMWLYWQYMNRVAVA